jgi:hypothetical protein
MKKLLTVSLLLCSLISFAQIQVTVGGNIFNLKTDTIILAQYTQQGYIDYIKAPVSKKGDFKLTGKLPAKDYYVLRISPNEHLNLILKDGADIKVYGDGKNINYFNNIIGSDESAHMNAFINDLRVFNSKKDSANAYLQKFPDQLDAVNQSFSQIFYEFNAVRQRFIAENPNSPALIPTLQTIDVQKEFAIYESVVNQLVTGFDGSPTIEQLKANFAQLKAQNQAIVALNTIEEQFKWVNDKTIDAAIAELDSTFTNYNINSTDMQTLESLAWDCPFDKGPAVFAARALMLKINPNSASYINPCETVQADENNQRTGAPIVWEYEYDPSEEHDMDYLLGIEQSNSAFANELKLYPNPSNSMITLESAELITKVEISNTLGQVILIDNGAVANIKSFNLKDLPKGLYLIKVYNNDNFAVKQLSLID